MTRRHGGIADECQLPREENRITTRRRGNEKHTEKECGADGEHLLVHTKWITKRSEGGIGG
ncbi:hypothetical protein D3C84_619560 [compost metagenome]